MNNGEQYKDNNNIVKYLESNKDSILGLAEKNYENLVEVLTKMLLLLLPLILRYHHPNHHRHLLIYTIKVMPTERAKKLS